MHDHAGRNAATPNDGGPHQEGPMRAFTRAFSLAVSTLCALATGSAMAQGVQGGVIRIGVLNDMSGVYSDDQGPGSLLAAQMAVEDFGGSVAGQKVEVVSGDHQNKTDLGAQIARRWFDNEGVAMIVDVPNSAIAFAVGDI